MLVNITIIVIMESGALTISAAVALGLKGAAARIGPIQTGTARITKKLMMLQYVE
jgi:hypothetical protein